MIQKTQVPEKGLLDVLFGGKADAAQAGNPAEGGVDSASGSTEDFAAALIEAQDQKDAKTAAQAKAAKGKAVTRSKGGKTADAKKGEGTEESKGQNPAQVKGQVQTQAQAQAQAAAQLQAQAQAQALAQAQVQAQTQAQAQEQGQVQATGQGQGRTQGQGKAQGQMGPAALRAQIAALQAAAAEKSERGVSKDGSLAGGVPGSESHEAGELRDAVIAAQQAAIASQRAAITAQDATIKAHEVVARGQQAQGMTTLQPIVIQTPLAIPVDVLEIEDGDQGGDAQMGPAVGGPVAGKGSPRSMVASQDFLAQMRAGGPMASKAAAFEHEEHSKSSHDDQNGSIAMMVPALGGHHAQAHEVSSIPVAAVPLEVGATRSGRAELANAATLANEVNSLAAKGGGSVKMRVMPESLGELTIHVKNEDGRLNVSFDASSREAREALTAAMPGLRQALSAAGRFEVGKLEVGGGAAGGALAIVRDGTGFGMSSWSNQSQFSDWQGGGGFGQDGQQAPNAWERYFDQQEGRRQQREQRAYQRYQEAMGT